MRDKACGFDIVGMRQHELFILRRACRVLAVLWSLQRTIDQRHCHRFALAHAEHQPVAAREVRPLTRRVDKTVDHFTLGHQQFADVHRKSQLFRHNRYVDIAAADLACERVVATVAALGGVGQRQQIAFVAAHQLL